MNISLLLPKLMYFSEFNLFYSRCHGNGHFLKIRWSDFDRFLFCNSLHRIVSFTTKKPFVRILLGFFNKLTRLVTVHSGEVPHGKQLGSIRTSLIVLSLHLYHQLFIAKGFTLPVKGTYIPESYLPSLATSCQNLASNSEPIMEKSRNFQIVYAGLTYLSK